MSDELDFLKLIANRLDSAGIRYMLTGSVALSLYAQPRMTRDIDLVIELSAAQATQFTDLFAKDCYVDEDVVHDATRRRGMFNIINNRSIVKADFIVRKNHPYREVEFARRLPLLVDNTNIFVVSREDLILSKLEWAKQSGSEMQNRDVSNLLKSARDLDWEYLRHWAEELGVLEHLGTIATHA